MQAHLIEREPKSENPLHCVDRQTEREMLGPSRIADPAEVVEGGFNRLGRRWLAPGGQRFSGLAQMLGCGLSNPRERCSKPLLKRVGKRRGGGPANHDQVVPEPQHGPQQRPQLRLGREKADPLVSCFRGDRLCLCDRLADAILKTRERRWIMRLPEPRKQVGRDRAIRSSARAAASIASEWARAGNTRSDTAKAVLPPIATSSTRSTADSIGPTCASPGTSKTNAPVNGAEPKLGLIAPRKAKGATASARTPASDNSLLWGTSTETAPA